MNEVVGVEGFGVSEVRTNQDHNTPEWVLDLVRLVGPIMLDPCSNPWSLVNAPAELSAHRGEDGLQAAWSEIVGDVEASGWHGGISFDLRAADLLEPLVFVNPPFAKGQVLRWATKAAMEATRGVSTILLSPADSSTRWHREVRNDLANARCDLGKRISFVGAADQGAKQPSALWYFGPRPFWFADRLQHAGAITILSYRDGTE